MRKVALFQTSNPSFNNKDDPDLSGTKLGVSLSLVKNLYVKYFTFFFFEQKITRVWVDRKT